MVSELAVPRVYILAATIDHDTLIAVGGYECSSKGVKIVETFDVNEKKWTRIGGMKVEEAGGIVLSL